MDRSITQLFMAKTDAERSIQTVLSEMIRNIEQYCKVNNIACDIYCSNYEVFKVCLELVKPAKTHIVASIVTQEPQWGRPDSRMSCWKSFSLKTQEDYDKFIKEVEFLNKHGMSSWKYNRTRIDKKMNIRKL
jgi:hypothetical protein